MLKRNAYMRLYTIIIFILNKHQKKASNRITASKAKGLIHSALNTYGYRKTEKMLLALIAKFVAKTLKGQKGTKLIFHHNLPHI